VPVLSVRGSASAEDERFRKQALYVPAPAGDLPGLAVMVCDGEVYPWTRQAQHMPFGPLAGAQAGVMSSKTGRGAAVAATASFGALGAVGALAGGSSFAYVVFADGRLIQVPLKGSHEVQRAQADALRFNALAQSAVQPQS
jgi:hypothetical protein